MTNEEIIEMGAVICEAHYGPVVKHFYIPFSLIENDSTDIGALLLAQHIEGKRSQEEAEAKND